MKKRIIAITIIFSFLLLSLLGIGVRHAIAQEVASGSSQQASDLRQRISELQSKITELQAEKKSLSTEISSLDSKISLSELRINSAKQDINDVVLDIDTAQKKVSNLEGSLSDLTKVLLSRIVATYQAGVTTSPIAIFASSDSLSDYASRENYLKIVQEHDKKLIYATIQARNDYANQKSIFETKKKKLVQLQKDLEEYSKQLAVQQDYKKKLLADTQGSEANYQKLLAQAKAQLAGFAKFASTQGGGILPPQPSPDGWYYNQRDERWGRNAIGDSSEAVWQYGCLLTSVAMVLKQKGESVTPLNIAADASYFFSNTAYMNNPWGNGRFASIWGYDAAAVDEKLAASQPVIVGVNAGPYGTHFIVLKSGSKGDYIMNDPWHGPNLAFSDHYSTGQIFQYGYLK